MLEVALMEINGTQLCFIGPCLKLNENVLKASGERYRNDG